MKTNNPLIECMELVRLHAARLDCTVIAVLDNVVLCHRSDNTFITWRAAIYCTSVDFNSGHYDMTAYAAQSSLIERAWDIHL